MISLTRSRIAASNPSRREPSWPTSIAVLSSPWRIPPDALNLSRRFRAFSFNDFSGEYAFYFSTGMGTEPADDEEWTVYLLIRAPKSASVELDTENGPMSFYDVDGKLTAHAHNGPISLKNFSGDAEITAVNGPISLTGISGNVRVHTENGPISVALKGTT